MPNIHAYVYVYMFSNVELYMKLLVDDALCGLNHEHYYLTVLSLAFSVPVSY